MNHMKVQTPPNHSRKPSNSNLSRNTIEGYKTEKKISFQMDGNAKMSRHLEAVRKLNLDPSHENQSILKVKSHMKMINQLNLSQIDPETEDINHARTPQLGKGF